MSPFQKIATLESKILEYIKYIQMKIDERDFHGVSDAANDIREFEAEIKAYRDVIISEKE